MSVNIFALPNESGYNLGINSPVISDFYKDFFRRFKLPENMGMDPQRIEYEKILWDYIRSVYRKYDPKLAKSLPKISGEYFLYTRVIGWQEEWLRLFLTEKLKLSKALEQFAEINSDKLALIAEKLRPSDIYLQWVSGNYENNK